MAASFEDITNFDWNNLSEQRLKQETESEWFDKLINTETAASSVSTTTATSPLEFSSLFDIEEDVSGKSMFSSTATSLDNTPVIKAEDMVLPVPQLDMLEDNASFTRNNSISSMCSLGSEEEQSTNSTTVASATETTATKASKPKKKRAPRKRLTAHQKQAHNKIEKRYRINIHAKIAGLQQIIPCLRTEKTAFEIGDGQKPDETVDVPRLNKSMILEKATGYILQLQENEKKMQEELIQLRSEILKLGGTVPSM